MKLVINILVILTLCAGVIFAKERKNNSRSDLKKIRADYSFVKDQSQNNDDSQLERTRSHKRRRKIRKPIKGLR